MRRLVLLAAAFAYLVLTIEALRAAVTWWQDETALGPLDFALIAALPLIVWIWWRYLSVFRKDCGKAACLLPQEPKGPGAGSGA